jgi:hypothetical protein
VLTERSQNGVATRTIEGTLFEALVKAGAVSQDNADDPVKVLFYFSCLCGPSVAHTTPGQPRPCSTH